MFTVPMSTSTAATRLLATVAATGPTSPAAAAAAAGVNPNTARRVMAELARAGKLTQPAKGTYAVPARRARRVPDRVAALVRDNLHIVEQAATSMSRSWPAHVDRSHLISAGNLALFMAARRYDETLGVPFPAYATPRVRGAMIDAARSLDGAGRHTRDRLNAAERARAALAATLPRPVTDIDVAEAAGMNPARLTADRLREQHTNTIRLDDPNLVHADGFAADYDADPALTVERGSVAELVRDTLPALPARERYIIEQVFFHGRPACEIAEEFGVTEARISQLRHQALSRLRGHLASLMAS